MFKNRIIPESITAEQNSDSYTHSSSQYLYSCNLAPSGFEHWLFLHEFSRFEKEGWFDTVDNKLPREFLSM